MPQTRFVKIAKLGRSSILQRKPFKRNLWKSQIFAQQSEGGGLILQTKSLQRKLLRKKKLLRKWSGGQFYIRNPFKRNFWKYQSFTQIGKKCSKKACCRWCLWQSQIFPQKVRGVQFYKRNPFELNLRKFQYFAQKVKRGSILQKKSL